MADSLKASTRGLEIVDRARHKKGWTKTETLEWWKAANTSQATLKRFWRGKPIDRSAFKGVCSAVGVHWKEVAENTIQEIDSPVSCSSTNSSAPDPNFVGREGAITNLNKLVNQGAKVILIHAKGGVGKTTLARKYFQQHFDLCIEFPIAKETQNITSVESLIEERLKQLGEEPGREFGVSLDRLKRKLQTERIGVLIDNLEPALDGNGKIIEPHRRYVELLRILANPEVQSVTLITSRECLHESAITVQNYLLEGLDLAAWQEFFNSRNVQTDTPALSAMHKAYGGNAKAMEILSSAIFQDYEGNLETYWQANQQYLLIERDLEDLVVCQFNRLQQLKPDTYQLLCRMGCYRYQDVPTVPEEGLFCLLWDVPEAQRRRVVKLLRDRSLIEFRNGEYWLHPVIRAEAIARLRASEDWETANRKSAEFWVESVHKVETRKDALKAFEAYHQYVEINDFEQAAEVIVKERTSKWFNVKYGGELLGRAFLRVGLMQPLFSGISLIVRNIETNYTLSRLYNLLGDVYVQIGYPKKAIEYHEKSKLVALECLKYTTESNDTLGVYFKLKMLEMLCFFNTGICQIDLWEIKEAIESFKEAYSISKSTITLNFFLGQIDFCLALLYSELDWQGKALRFANKAYKNITQIRDNPWGRGYSLLFLGKTYSNLGDTQKSFDLYCQAISFAEETYYFQVKANALSGLAELYRERREFETALSHHSVSIKLLDKIGAKCDLSEAYYQLGLTYKKMDNAQKSQENFDKAIQLFSEMEAPKQVEKVRQAMESKG